MPAAKDGLSGYAPTKQISNFVAPLLVSLHSNGLFRNRQMLVVLTAVKSAPKKPCSMPDQKVRGMTSSWLGSFMCLHNSTKD